MARQDKPDVFALTPPGFAKFLRSWAAQVAPAPPPYIGSVSSDNLQWVQLTSTTKTGDYYPGQRMRWQQEAAAFTAEDSCWVALANDATPNTSNVWLARDNGDYDNNGDERPAFVAGDACCDAGGGSGDVTGPGSSTDRAIVIFNGTTGKIIQNQTVITINATGQIVSVLTTGNAPFVVSSTTQVNNLNVQYLGGFESSDYWRKNELLWLDPCIVASTANVNLSTDVEDGDTLDGVTLLAGMRILLKDQTTQTENGPWVVAASGPPSRPADFATGLQVGGAMVVVNQGTANNDTVWMCTNNAGSDTVDIDNLTWERQPKASDSPAAHASDHIRGGSDEVDGDQIDIDLPLTNITADTTPAQVSNAAHLSSIIKGIDNDLFKVDIDGLSTNSAFDRALDMLVRYSATMGQNYKIDVDEFFYDYMPLFHARYELSDGSNGGTATSGSWMTRPINTVVRDPHNQVSIATNVISIAKGQWLLAAWGPFYLTDFSRNRIQNTTAGSTIAKSHSSGYHNSAQGSVEIGLCFGFGSWSATAAIEVQYKVSQTRSSTGLGYDNNEADGVETYGNLIGVRVGHS